MKATTIIDKLIASSLSVLLASCSATRNTAPVTNEELPRLVLIIRELPDGQATHTWQPAEDFDLSQYQIHTNAHSTAGHIVFVSSRQRNCDEELLECIRECMSRPLPRGYGHITAGRRGLGGKDEHCRKKCNQPYQDCMDLQDRRPQEFSAIDGAVDWLKRNRKEVLLGSIIIIAGVVFVVVSAGAGLVVLAPAVLVASADLPAEPYTAAVSP